MSHFGGYQYLTGSSVGRKTCLMRERLPTPLKSGCFLRAYFDTSQKRFWQSIRLQFPAPEVTELEAKAMEFVLLAFRNHSDKVRFGQTTKVSEALANAVEGTWAGNDELHFRKVSNVAVVQVGYELIGEEIADGRVGTQQTEGVPHGVCTCNPLRYLVCHHLFDKPEGDCGASENVRRPAQGDGMM